jgi:predicted N-acetyltransferase YhbS
MWWVPENRLAYMEPLCTVPEHRGKGLAAAALSMHVRRLRPLGARLMTGGGSPFYARIGYNREIHWQHWEKEQTT